MSNDSNLDKTIIKHAGKELELAMFWKVREIP